MISIIIPVYNCEDKVNNLINDIKNQNYEDYEVILIDDGSTDSSGKICDSIADTDFRIKCFHKFNQGAGIARNEGLKKAKGDYIAFLDADDSIEGNYFFELMKCCTETNADIVVCDVVMERGNKEIYRFSGENRIFSQNAALNELLTRKKINSGPCAKLYKKEIVKNIVFPDLRTYEDILFNIDAFSRANIIASTDKTKYRYMLNDYSSMGKMRKLPSTDIIVATEKILEFFRKANSLEPECFYITISHLMQYVQSICFDINDAAIEFKKKSIDVLRKYRKDILTCNSFPWKEKLVYCLLSYGYLYYNRKLIKLEMK